MLARMDDGSVPALDQLTRRLDRLERSNHRLKFSLLGVGAIAFGCGAGTTAQFKKATSHHLAIFGAEEKGEVVTLSRTQGGGQIVVRDAAGKARVSIDGSGVRVRDAAGKVTWSSTSP